MGRKKYFYSQDKITKLKRDLVIQNLSEEKLIKYQKQLIKDWKSTIKPYNCLSSLEIEIIKEYCKKSINWGIYL